MKNLYSAVLVANLAIESVGALALFAAPEMLVDVENASAMLWAWNYGFVALAIGTAIFWAWPHRDSFSSVGAVLGILLSFHLAIAVALAIADELFVDVVVHGLFAVLCLYLLTQRNKWCLEVR